MSRVLAAVLLLASLPVSAAIVYEPVQYQYGDQHRYYYGGTDPAMHRYAQSYCDRRTIRDAEGQLSGKPARVFTDCLPRRNAALYGWTSVDAMNEATASIPRYFRMSSLLAGGRIDAAGDLVIPARPDHLCGKIEVKPWRGWANVASPKPVIVIPKEQLRLDAPLATPEKPSKA
jgi:hypothetical protein